MLDVSSDLGLIRIGLYQALEEIELDSDGSLTTPTELSWRDTSIQEELNCKDLEYNLLELLMNRRYVKALRLTRQYRSESFFDFYFNVNPIGLLICLSFFIRQCWPHDYFGTSDDEEVSAILRVFGRYVASKKSCTSNFHFIRVPFRLIRSFVSAVLGAIIATCPDESSLNDSCNVIMDFNMQTQLTLKNLEKSLMNLTETRSDRSDYCVRKTEC